MHIPCSDADFTYRVKYRNVLWLHAHSLESKHGRKFLFLDVNAACNKEKERPAGAVGRMAQRRSWVGTCHDSIISPYK